jgi:alkylhydroperoxidase/carboxymuconolactone decarboxylase family protein YurZ
LVNESQTKEKTLSGNCGKSEAVRDTRIEGGAAQGKEAQMADEGKGKKIRNLVKEMKKERGCIPVTWSYLAKNDVDFMEAYYSLYDKSLGEGRSLSAKIRELIVIVLLAYRGSDEAVYAHCKRALELGATEQELLEAIETSIIPGGAPTFRTGLQALMRIEKEKKYAK